MRERDLVAWQPEGRGFDPLFLLAKVRSTNQWRCLNRHDWTGGERRSVFKKHEKKEEREEGGGGEEVGTQREGRGRKGAGGCCVFICVKT